MRKAFVAALALSLAVVPASAKLRKHGGSAGVVIPPGVTFQAIDGGPTYYSTGSWGLGTNIAAQSRTFGPNACPSGVGTNRVYSAGWDDSKFYSIGPFLDLMNSQSAANTWIDLVWNTAWTYSGTGTGGSLALFLCNGISVVQGVQYWGQVIGNGDVTGNETVGFQPVDEPNTIVETLDWAIVGTPQVNFTGVIGPSPGLQNVLTASSVTGLNLITKSNCLLAFSAPIITGAGVSANNCIGSAGIPGLGGNGTYGITNADVGSEPMSQSAVSPLTAALQNGRFNWMNFTNSWISTGTFAGSSTNTILTRTVSSAGGVSRHIDMQGIDQYFFTFAQGNGSNLQTCSDIYQPGQPAMTRPQCAKGTHYGDMVDYMRSFATASGAAIYPIGIYIETSNGCTGISYAVSPQELMWAQWAAVIHGARAHNIFDTDGCGGSWIGGGFPITSSWGTNVQSAAIGTGSIAAGAGGCTPQCLTATTVTAGHIQSGMALTGSGVVGTPIILQQVTGTNGLDGTYAIDSGSGSGSSWTVTQAACTQSVSCQQKLYDQHKATNAMIATMAPVINSPNAKAYATTSNTRYAFETPPPQTSAFGKLTGIDYVVKYYTGGTYTTSGFGVAGESITNGFYIFATTANTELQTNSSVTFTVPSVSSVTVINEARSIVPSSGTTFVDSFKNAWTTHIYRVNP